MPKLIPQISSKQAALIFAIVSVLFLSYCSYGVYRTFNPGPGTTDIDDYPEMRTRFRDIYPWANGILPPHIPPSATEIEFDAFPHSILQGRPSLDLGFTLSPEDTQSELDRLLKLGTQPILNEDSAQVFDFSDHLASQYGFVTYDPRTNSFWYELHSD